MEPHESYITSHTHKTSEPTITNKRTCDFDLITKPIQLPLFIYFYFLKTAKTSKKLFKQLVPSSNSLKSMKLNTLVEITSTKVCNCFFN